MVIKEHTLLDLDYLSEPQTVLDLGACFGEFSFELKQHCHPDSKFFLFEANPTSFQKIPNFFQKENLFVSNYSGTTLFYEDDVQPYNSTGISPWFSRGVTHLIKTIPLSDLLPLYPKIDILKIDIEGSEFWVFDGVKQQDFDKIRQITIEFHDFLFPQYRDAVKKIVQQIMDKGFLMKTSPTEYGYGSSYFDCLFYREQDKEFLKD